MSPRGQGERRRRPSAAGALGAGAALAIGLHGAVVLAACETATEPSSASSTGTSTGTDAATDGGDGEADDARKYAKEDAQADAQRDARSAEGADSSDAMAAEAGDAGPTPSAPCRRPPADVGARSDACLARLPLAGRELPYYRSHGLESADPAIEHLVLIQHGNSRNAWDYYDTVAAAAALRDSGRTAVLAPLFQAYNATCGYDAKAPNDLYWGCSDWKEGGSRATPRSTRTLPSTRCSRRQKRPSRASAA